MEVENLDQARQLVSELKQSSQKAEDEVRSVRQKLHGAIRKGKASEAARVELEKRVEELTSRINQLSAQVCTVKIAS